MMLARGIFEPIPPTKSTLSHAEHMYSVESAQKSEFVSATLSKFHFLMTIKCLFFCVNLFTKFNNEIKNEVKNEVM